MVLTLHLKSSSTDHITATTLHTLHTSTLFHSDFGASKLNHHDDRGNSNVQSMAGTVYWMAPEVIKGEAYGGLGVLINSAASHWVTDIHAY